MEILLFSSLSKWGPDFDLKKWMCYSILGSNVFMRVIFLLRKIYHSFFKFLSTDLFVGASQVMLVVKNPSASAGDTGSTPGSSRPLEEMATPSGTLPERNPTGRQRVGHGWAPLSLSFWPHWAFSAKHGHSLAEASGSYSGFSRRWLSMLQSTGSRQAGFRSCACWLRRCGTCALLLWGMWDLPVPGTDPLAPALAGRFLTIDPPGKRYHFYCCLVAVVSDSGIPFLTIINNIQTLWEPMNSILKLYNRKKLRIREGRLFFYIYMVQDSGQKEDFL